MRYERVSTGAQNNQAASQFVYHGEGNVRGHKVTVYPLFDLQLNIQQMECCIVCVVNVQTAHYIKKLQKKTDIRHKTKHKNPTLMWQLKTTNGGRNYAADTAATRYLLDM